MGRTAKLPNSTIFTIEGITAILKACGEAKVAELQFGPLHVRFGTSANGESVEPSLPRAEAAEIAKIQEKEAEKEHVRSELELRRDQLAELLLLDPLAAENLMTSGDLEETTDGDRAEEA